MKKEITKVVLVLKPKMNNEFKNMVHNLTIWLNRRGKEVFILKNQDEAMLKSLASIEKNQAKLITYQELKTTNLVISLGGDGTLIGLSRSIPSNIPIYGVNWGYLGFITEFKATSMYEHLTDILKNQFEIVKKPLYQIEIFHHKKSIFKSNFINDVVISKNDIARLFSLNIESNQDSILNLAGDGLIISTPIGSTAYSLAAGGPIVHPEVRAFILTPICPHSLNHRPIVISDRSKIKISLAPGERPVMLTVDGQISHELNSQHSVSIRFVNKKISFIKNKGKTFFHTLKEKFIY